MHPRNPERLTFAESYFDGELLRYVAALVNGSAGALGDKKEEGEEDDLVMELYNLLVRPDVDFALRWHRDDIPATATPEEELERLNKPGWHAQWNLPLYDDASLIVVPGSHTRARTEAERNADPYEPNMPNQKIVELKAGEVVFYNNNILHRGVYTNGKERMTLHGSVGSRRAGTARARNVLQHGVGEWAGTEGFEGLQDRETRERAEVMRKRLCELGGRSGDVGFFAKDE